MSYLEGNLLKNFQTRIQIVQNKEVRFEFIVHALSSCTRSQFNFHHDYTVDSLNFRLNFRFNFQLDLYRATLPPTPRGGRTKQHAPGAAVSQPSSAAAAPRPNWPTFRVVWDANEDLLEVEL